MSSEILQKITDFAQTRSDITYVIQNGSRVNPSIIPDEYADFDIIMGCKNPQNYSKTQNWIYTFGDLLILQQNEITEDSLTWPIFLLQFFDGLRIDLQFYPGDGIKKYQQDSLSRILLDKDALFTKRFDPSEETYIVGKPDKQTYLEKINEFWWCIINVGKGIVRNELTYSRFMYESVVRENFLHIVSWFVSWKHDWGINTGKFGKFLQKYTDEQTWNQIQNTYYTDSPDKFWNSIFHACDLIKRIDRELRKELCISEKEEDAERIIQYLKRIQRKGDGY